MNKYRMVLWLVCMGFSVQGMADDKKPCAAAVDAADSMNVNQRADCDYSTEGLNGYLHKAFNADKKETAPAAEIKSSPLQQAAKKADRFSVIVDQWAAVPLARNQLLPKIMEVCSNGFRVLAEEYRPLTMGRISVELNAECLEK